MTFVYKANIVIPGREGRSTFFSSDMFSEFIFLFLLPVSFYFDLGSVPFGVALPGHG